MDLTEEDIQIWYFGPDAMWVPSSNCPPGLILVSQPGAYPGITIGDIKYSGESHCISCICTNYTSPNYLYPTYGYIAPSEMFQDVG